MRAFVDAVDIIAFASGWMAREHAPLERAFRAPSVAGRFHNRLESQRFCRATASRAASGATWARRASSSPSCQLWGRSCIGTPLLDLCGSRRTVRPPEGQAGAHRAWHPHLVRDRRRDTPRRLRPGVLQELGRTGRAGRRPRLSRTLSSQRASEITSGIRCSLMSSGACSQRPG